MGESSARHPLFGVESTVLRVAGPAAGARAVDGEAPTVARPVDGEAPTLPRAPADGEAETVARPVDGEAPTVVRPAGGGAAAGGRGVAAERFEALGLLGEGGMGRVDRVLDRDLLREVAVKRLRPDLAGDRRMLDQFLWEARVTAHLDHPNIVPVHDIGVAPDGELYLTMKLVRGRSLDAALGALHEPGGEAETGLHLARRLRLFLQVCNAVSFAHARGVLHRDLKPANVLIGEHGEVLVTDWGIAVPLPDAPGDALRPLVPDALRSVSAGTPMYMSPEQAHGGALDARSDVFALGCILYELAALRRAFDGTSLAAILERVKRAEKVPLREAAPGASSALAAVVDKATARDPDERYASVRALADDVETVLDGRTPEAESTSLVRQAARYYLARDPGLSRLRVVDFDMWIGGACIAGAGVGAVAAPHIGHWWWALVVAGMLVMIRPTWQWLHGRKAR